MDGVRTSDVAIIRRFLRLQLTFSRFLQLGPAAFVCCASAWLGFRWSLAWLGIPAVAIVYAWHRMMLPQSPILVLRPFSAGRAYDVLDWFVLPILPFVAPVVTLQDRELRSDQFRGIGALGIFIMPLAIPAALLASFAMGTDVWARLAQGAAVLFTLECARFLYRLFVRIRTPHDVAHQVRSWERPRNALFRLFERRSFVLRIESEVWREAVARFMEISVLLVFVIDPWLELTPGLHWELTTAMNTHRRVLVFAIERTGHDVTKLVAALPELDRERCIVVPVPLPANGRGSRSRGLFDHRRDVVARALIASLH